jgi:transcriptional regulator GlxA family with amidase domain
MFSSSIRRLAFGVNVIICHIYAMPQVVAMLAFDGFQLLDVAGPASVYGAANDLLGNVAYKLVTIAREVPCVTSSCGVGLAAVLPSKFEARRVHSVFVSGGKEAGLRKISSDRTLAAWTRRAARSAQRYGSICSGSVVLAAWGMLGTRRFASHWEAVPYIQGTWPELKLDPNAIFVQDGPLWTSAGVTTGMDMTLAIVEQDHGPELAHAIAQKLVVSVRRPGWQSQFSPLLEAQSGAAGRYANLIAWIATHLTGPLDVDSLAARAGQSVRSFQRSFTAATGKSPGRFVAAQRLDRAINLVRAGKPLKEVAAQCGYADPGQLSAAFLRLTGMTAGAFRTVHAPLSTMKV